MISHVPMILAVAFFVGALAWDWLEDRAGARQAGRSSRSCEEVGGDALSVVPARCEPEATMARRDVRREEEMISDAR